MCVAQIKNLPNVLCRTVHFADAIGTYFELLVPPGAADQVTAVGFFGMKHCYNKEKSTKHNFPYFL